MNAPEMTEDFFSELSNEIKRLTDEARKRPFGLFLSPSDVAIGSAAKRIYDKHITAAHAAGMEEAAKIAESLCNNAWEYEADVAAAIRAAIKDQWSKR